MQESSLMFAKFSPDGNSIAYVSENNVYAENYATGKIEALTSDGSVTLINGTFDWAYCTTHSDTHRELWATCPERRNPRAALGRQSWES